MSATLNLWAGADMIVVVLNELEGGEGVKRREKGEEDG